MRSLRYSVVLVSCLTCHQTALALDPKLVEFGWSQPNPVTLPAQYVALVESNSWNGHNFFNTITEYPTSQYADPTAVEFWNQNCADGTNCGVGFSNGGQQPSQFFPQHNLDQVLGGPNKLWADGWDGNPQPFLGHAGTWHATPYVPQLGGPDQALFGYKITAVEREITATTQTIRLYGTLIPEPSAWLLALLGCIAHISRRRRRCIL